MSDLGSGTSPLLSSVACPSHTRQGGHWPLLRLRHRSRRVDPSALVPTLAREYLEEKESTSRGSPLVSTLRPHSFPLRTSEPFVPKGVVVVLGYAWTSLPSPAPTHDPKTVWTCHVRVSVVPRRERVETKQVVDLSPAPRPDVRSLTDLLSGTRAATEVTCSFTCVPCRPSCPTRFVPGSTLRYVEVRSQSFYSPCESLLRRTSPRLSHERPVLRPHTGPSLTDPQ